MFVYENQNTPPPFADLYPVPTFVCIHFQSIYRALNKVQVEGSYKGLSNPKV